MAAEIDNLTRRLLSSLPEGVPAGEKAKKMLLQLLGAEIPESDYIEILWQLAGFYIKARRNDLAIAFIQAVAESTDDSEEQADCYLRLGQLAEQERQYNAACDHYTKGLARKPTGKQVAYFLHNNLGYCLNLRGEHAKAERLCRAAIEIDSNRANAFKNLGIALAGQNDLIGAAWAWIEAMRANAHDERSLFLLEQLIDDHPEIASQLPGNWQEVEACKELVQAAVRDHEPIVDTYEICRLRHVPGKGYFQIKDGIEAATSAEEIEALYSEEALKMLSKYAGTWCSIVGEGAENASLATQANAEPKSPEQSGALEPALLIRGHAAKH